MDTPVAARSGDRTATSGRPRLRHTVRDAAAGTVHEAATGSDTVTVGHDASLQRRPPAEPDRNGLMALSRTDRESE